MPTDLMMAAIAAIKSALQDDTTLKTLVGDPVRLTEAADLPMTFPYLHISQIDSRDASIKGQAALSLLLTLRIPSRQRKGDEVRAIVAALRTVLQDITASSISRCQEEQVSIYPTDTGMIGLVRYRVIVA